MLDARRAFAVAVALFALGLSSLGRASDGLPIAVGDQVAFFARFPNSSPAAVAVSASLFNPATLSFSSIGSEAATKLTSGFETWYVRLSALDDTSSLPQRGDCTERYLLVLWAPDGADCTASPSLCIAEVFSIGGHQCRQVQQRQADSFVFATGLVPSQGINQAVLDYYSLRGQLPIRWRELKLGGLVEQAVTTSERLVWEVYRYSSGPGPPRLNCVVTTEVNPNTVLPSFSQCAGN